MQSPAPSPHLAVLLGGACEPTPALLDHLADARAVAADGGMRHAGPLGFANARAPLLWVGDFDSTEADIAARHADVPREAHPVAKDATDGEIALDAARRMGARRITLVGAFGGARLDHTLGAIALALGRAAAGLDIVLTDGRQWGRPLLAEHPFAADLAPGTVLSVIGLDDLAGLDLDGVRWPLDGAELPLGSTLTLSNQALGGRVRARLRTGRALVVAQGPDRAPRSGDHARRGVHASGRAGRERG